tara:strand:+ start:371 stop:532 length:162 start_codon:yes stop_codon:yes gene_type:complete
MIRIKFTQMELEVIEYALELSQLDRKPKYQRAMQRAQQKIHDSGIEFKYHDID